MTKLISLRVTLAVDDIVDIKDVKPLLGALISAKGTENLGENGNASGGRIHWGTCDILQGPDRVVGRKGGKRAAQGQGDLGVARDGDRQFLEQLSCKLADEGKLIEAGWVSLRLHAIPLNAPPIQLEEMRMAFMAGAQHLFASIMTILTPGQEKSLADLRRLDLIHQELMAFAKQLELRVGKPAGRA